MSMGHIYYLIGLLLLFLNIPIISKYFKYFKLIEWSVMFKKVTKRDPIKIDYKSVDDHGFFILSSQIIKITTFWLFLGILTKSYYIYIIILLFNILFNYVSKLGEFSNIVLVLSFFKYLIVLLIICLLIINHFHLHIDLLKILI